MNEIEILAQTYEDACDIFRIQDVTNDLGITEQEYTKVAENVPCALSQVSQLKNTLNVVKGMDMVNLTNSENVLFCRPNVNIKKADKVVITQPNGNIETAYVKEFFWYKSHIEIGLIGREIDG